MTEKKGVVYRNATIGVGILCAILLVAVAYLVLSRTSPTAPDTNNWEQKYNDYVGTHSHSNDEYNGYVSSHSHTNSEYDALQNQINSLKTPNLVSVNMKYEDNRPFLQDAYMRVYGYVVNVGTNTANNAKIHVIIYQGATVAKDTTISLGSISGESYTSVDTKVYYTGSAITTYSANLEFS